jgi:hypothetical protein
MAAASQLHHCCIDLLLREPLQASDKDSAKIDPTKHHPQHLCEKCKQLAYYCRNSHAMSYYDYDYDRCDDYGYGYGYDYN